MKFKSDKQRKAVMTKLRYLKPLPFKSKNRLPVQISVIVPSTKMINNKSKKISKKEFEKRIKEEKKYMDNIFGGDTSIRTTGSYIDSKGKLIEEKGALIEASTTKKKFETNRKELARHLEKRKDDWKQETILAKVEGQTFIIPKKDFIDDDTEQSDKILIT